MQPFSGYKSCTLLANGISFQNTRNEVPFVVWYLVSEEKYLVSKPAVVKILTGHNVRKLKNFMLPVSLQQQFKKEAKDAYGIEVQSSFYEVNGQLLELLKDVSTHSDIANEISKFINL